MVKSSVLVKTHTPFFYIYFSCNENLTKSVIRVGKHASLSIKRFSTATILSCIHLAVEHDSNYVALNTLHFPDSTLAK